MDWWRDGLQVFYVEHIAISVKFSFPMLNKSPLSGKFGFPLNRSAHFSVEHRKPRLCFPDLQLAVVSLFLVWAVRYMGSRRCGLWSTFGTVSQGPRGGEAARGSQRLPDLLMASGGSKKGVHYILSYQKTRCVEVACVCEIELMTFSRSGFCFSRAKICLLLHS